MNESSVRELPMGEHPSLPGASLSRPRSLKTTQHMGTALKRPQERGEMRPTCLWEATQPGRTRTWQVAGPWEPEQQRTRKSRVSEQAQEASWRRQHLSKTGSFEGYRGGCKEPEYPKQEG